MPKAAVGQTGFSTGEISPLCFGATDNPRYKKGLEVATNYIPVLQGPLVRRPGTKFCQPVKDANNPPILVPFKFSATQSYMLEFGANYIRFFANNGQLINPNASFRIMAVQNGRAGTAVQQPQWPFYACRTANTRAAGEGTTAGGTTTPVAAGAILECPSPYAAVDLPLLRWAQTGDTLYLVHPYYPPYKLLRQAQTDWKLQPVALFDGPYLPSNSYQRLGDNVNVQWNCINSPQFPYTMVANSIAGVTNAAKDPNSNQILITTNVAHGLQNGQSVFVNNVKGTVEANNYSRNPGAPVATGPAAWQVQVASPTSLILLGSTFTNAYTSGGLVNAAPMAPGISNVPYRGPDVGRLFAVIVDGIRYWGTIIDAYDAATLIVSPGQPLGAGSLAIPNGDTSTQWFLGKWSGWGGNGGDQTNGPLGGPVAPFQGLGFPSTLAFHQNRLIFAGGLNSPLDVDGSVVGNFEAFSPSVYSTLQVQDNNAFSFTLAAPDVNPIRWLASTAQGLVAASFNSEWAMTPSSSAEALTPTNFNAAQTSFFGGAQIAAVQIGNSVLYVQRAARKLREMAYFFSAGTFRSSDLSEISEHITLPAIAQLDVQKETQPLVWARRTDGALATLVYNRDDLSLSAGWSKHFLGGRSDAVGTPPIVLAIGFIPDPTVSFDQMWAVVQRYVNNTKVVYVEYMSKISDSSIDQTDSVQGDCAGTYDVPISISSIQKTTVIGSGPGNIVTTSAAHGLVTGNQVRLANVLGLNVSTTDINNNTTTRNLVNVGSFYVNVTSATTFNLVDSQGKQIDLSAGSAYLAGTGQVRKMVTTISGATWLAGETVGVLADGGIHPDVVVSAGGVISLQYPAAKVQFGYRFKSQGKLLRAEAGGADGTSIGKTRRTNRAAIQLYRTGDIAIGTSFTDLIPIRLDQADQNAADTAFPLFSGMVREGLVSAYDFESQLCFEQSSMLPSTIQSITTIMEEFDV